MSFGADVGNVLASHGVAHGLLGESEHEVDVAVAPRDLRTLDAALRLGALGRVLQAADYEAPFSRWYVLETPGGYRWLDVVCDPWGIGRYGAGPAAALRTPGSAGLLCYLAAKRASKHDDAEPLRALFAEAPAAAAAALRDAFGAAGAALAAALERDEPLEPGLAGLAAAIARRRRTPAALVLRALFDARRSIRRVRRPTGLALVLAGPDGVGKSTTTQALLALRPSPFRGAVRLGQRRGPLGPPSRLLGRRPGDAARPHERRPSGLAGSSARLAYMWLDALLGWLPRIALPRVRSTLVVQERGYEDTSVDPTRYRLSTPPWVARAFARLLPRADLVLLLDAPAELVRARKPELPQAEVERQLATWRARGHAVVDASGTAEETLARVLAAIADHLAARAGSLAPAATAAAALGPPATDGERFHLVSRHGRPRFLLPPRVGPVRAGVYVPGRRRDGAGAALLGRLGPTLRLDTRRGLGSALAAALGVPAVELAAAAQRDDERGGRALLAVHAGGRLAAYAKVAQQGDAALTHERAVLELLATLPLRSIVAPRVLGVVEDGGLTALLLEPLAVRGNPLRRLGAAEIEAVAELSALGAALAPALGRAPGLVPLHGDFAPWNCGLAPDGRLALWDWEEARLGPPLEDVFHWTMERMLLLGRGDAEALLRAALDPEPPIAALGARLGVAAPGRRLALRSALEHSSHREALALLREAS